MNSENNDVCYIPHQTQYSREENLRPGEDFPGEFSETPGDGLSETSKKRRTTKFRGTIKDEP